MFSHSESVGEACSRLAVVDPLWHDLRAEARKALQAEPMLSGFV